MYLISTYLFQLRYLLPSVDYFYFRLINREYNFSPICSFINVKKTDLLLYVLYIFPRYMDIYQSRNLYFKNIIICKPFYRCPYFCINKKFVKGALLYINPLDDLFILVRPKNYIPIEYSSTRSDFSLCLSDTCT